MKHPYLFILCLVISVFCYSQKTEIVDTKLISRNDYNLSIIQIFPDSFPQVSVIFQAKNNLGEPLWLLEKKDFGIRENDSECKVIAVRNISNNTPVNIALAFDHSSSMLYNPNITFDSLGNYIELDQTIPENSMRSIDFAKEGILKFFSTEKVDQDSILFVGFSETVDFIPPLTNDYDKLKKIVNNVSEGGSTAFYDALYTSIDSLVLHKSKSIIIGLTDGSDNSSSHSHLEVIAYAKENNISIYIIGLGFVDSNHLKELTSETKGMYYHTSDPTKLNEIYSNIKRQIKSIYELDYTSLEEHNVSSNRNIEFYFKNDTLTFSNDNHQYEIPKEVIEYMETRYQKQLEREEQARLDEEYSKQVMLYSVAGGSIILLGIGAFILLGRAKKSKKLEITNVYPNPISGPTTIDYSVNGSHNNLSLTISSVNGKLIYTKDLSPDEDKIKLNLTQLKKGIYLAQIKSESNRSEAIKIIRK